MSICAHSRKWIKMKSKWTWHLGPLSAAAVEELVWLQRVSVHAVVQSVAYSVLVQGGGDKGGTGHSFWPVTVAANFVIQ